MGRYTLDAGRLIVRDGVPFATLHGVRPYDPVELDAFAREVVAVLTVAPELLAALKRTADFLEGIGILSGPQAAAFGIQQREFVAKARAAIARAEGGE